MVGRAFRWIIEALAIWVLVGALSSAAAHTQGSPGGPTGYRSLTTCVFPAAAASDVRAAVQASMRIDCARPQTSYGAGDFWAVSEPLRIDTGRDDPWHVRIASLWQQSVTLHVLFADGFVWSERLDQQGLTRHIDLGAMIEQQIPERASPVVRLIWRVEGSANMRGVLLGARLMTAEQSKYSTLLIGGVYFGFVGLAVALILYNLAMWSALKYRMQLNYCLMVLGLLGYAFSSSGLLAWVLPNIANNDRLCINHLLLLWSAAAGLMFTRSFFEPRVFAGWLDRVTSALIWLMLGAGVAFVLFAPLNIRLFDRLYALSLLPVLLLVPTILVVARLRRSAFFGLYGLAWGPPVVLAGMRLAGNFGLIRWNFWLDNSTILAMAIESMVSTLAIAYRIRLLIVERDQAREQELAARKLADTDPLTGLLNRRAFLNRAVTRGGAQRLILVDIDHFKGVNETLGHDGGDEVLRVFARTLRRLAPADALVARLGGEEFGILLPADIALASGDILSAIRAARMPFDLAVTASIGTSSGPLGDEVDWKKLYRCADRALFDAKAAGRDRARDGSPSPGISPGGSAGGTRFAAA